MANDNFFVSFHYDIFNQYPTGFLFFVFPITGPPPALDDSSQQTSSGVGEGTPTHKAMADRRQLITEMRKCVLVCGIPQGSFVGPPKQFVYV